MKAKMAGGAADEMLSKKVDINGVAVLAAEVKDMDANAMRTLGDQLKNKLGSGVIVLAGAAGGKVSLMAMATDDAVKKGAHAGNIIKAAAAVCGGGGGGHHKPDPKPTPDPDPKPPVDIPDQPTPLDPLKPTENIPDNKVPTTKPETQTKTPDKTKTVNIPDSKTPTSSVPKTGDIGGLWAALCGLSAMGLAYFGIRRKHD